MSTPLPPPPGGSPLPPPSAPGGQWPTAPYGAAPSHGGATGFSGYSSWGKRFGATIVRGVSLIPAYLPAGVGVAIGGAISDALGVILALLGAVYFLAVAIRFYIQRGHLGTDIGDAVVGQVLVREATGAPMGSGWSIFGRNLLSFVNSLPFYLGWLWPLWDAKRQTFVDKILSTVVVERPVRHSAGVLFRNAYEVWKPVLKS